MNDDLTDAQRDTLIALSKIPKGTAMISREAAYPVGRTPGTVDALWTCKGLATAVVPALVRRGLLAVEGVPFRPFQVRVTEAGIALALKLAPRDPELDAT